MDSLSNNSNFSIRFQFPVGRRSACDIYWHGVSFHNNDNILSGQVNKFPGMIEMLRKINLSRAVRTIQELFPEEDYFYHRSWILPEEILPEEYNFYHRSWILPEEYNFYPRSWILPEEYYFYHRSWILPEEYNFYHRSWILPEEYNFYPRSWILPGEYYFYHRSWILPEEYYFYPRSWILPEDKSYYYIVNADASLKPTFIAKPDRGSQGDGTYLIRDPSDLRVIAGSQTRQSVVQEYIHKPRLIDKLKLDIRLYELVKSLELLEIYIAKEGLSRFCTEPQQEPSQKNLSHVLMHLTNYSLSVQTGNFVHSDSLSSGNKRTFSSVLYRLASKGVDIKKVWSDIISLVIKTVIALVNELKVYYLAIIRPVKPGPTCFQILGFDILLMKNLKPVLLELNANPSMRIEHEQKVSPGVCEYIPSPVEEEVKVGVIRDTLHLMNPGSGEMHQP
ncbi:LOW QUALITY PROTEIN: tubulin polyglutamylase TTLL11-like [Salvelinus sp. IW2-2015]|uniref:LOW QUALITY PROTEIN: tubulin polyglutamylase TTLL11-like n=1 Tax=Salvelinus sp. IW2-2015 TaxID=2691554 RepID=UPI0038D3D5E8